MDKAFHRIVEVHLAHLPSLLDDFIRWGTPVDKKTTLSLALSIDELFMNTLHHGYKGIDIGPQGMPLFRVDACIKRASRMIEVHCRDWGKPFNPIENKALKRQEILSNLESRPIGGVGLTLIAALTDYLSYTKEYDGANLVIFSGKF